MSEHLLDIAVALVIGTVIIIYFTWRNLPKNKTKYALAILAAFALTIVMSFAIPKGWQASSLFGPAIIVLFFLCTPLIRQRFRGSPEAQATFRKFSRQGKWKPPLWWAPLLIIGGFAWAFLSLLLWGASDSSGVAAAIFVPFVALVLADCAVIGYRLYLWQMRLMLGDDNNIR